MTRRAALGATAGLLLSPAAMAAPTYQGLFRIERSKNANIVQYDAVLASRDKLDPKEPVVAYWVLHAEDGRREGLTSLDRRAYGFKVRAEPNDRWLLYLNASRDRSIRVLRWQGRWVAQIVIGGRSAVLERMYVSSDESALIPRVRWIDLFGTDMETGKPLTERLKP
ncbi:MAG: hypothetical protein K0S65_487 [Labilithrix sp.]|jgi:hypothetical protein|nr:hypothetical protein [Labilithrix sp.]